MATRDDELGQISTDADGTITLRFVRRLAHAPPRVWAALTETEQIARWFMPGTVEPRIGGHVKFESEEEGGTLGEVMMWNPPRQLEYSWLRAGGAGPRSVVAWRLEADGDGTLLTLEHRGVDNETASGYGAGWHDFLDRLPRHLAGEDALNWTGHHAELVEAYRALT
ncbi:MAG: SRPBCC family protein [Chloroflexota bacterium]|nr:SRPBCC family protein [Chloroflexota bacterium]